MAIEEKLTSETLADFLPDQEMFTTVAKSKVFYEAHKDDVKANPRAYDWSSHIPGAAKKFKQMPWYLAAQAYKKGQQPGVVKMLCCALLLDYKDLLAQLKRTVKNVGLSKTDISSLINEQWDKNIKSLISMAKQAESETKGFDITESLDAEEQLQEKVEKHDELNPKLWNGDKLKPEVEEKINAIVDDFLKWLEDDEIKIDVKDVRLVGSNCSYNYNDNSDLDVHIVAKSDGAEDLRPLLYNAYKTMWNNNHDIEFYGIPVEIFVEVEDDDTPTDEEVEESLDLHENLIRINSGKAECDVEVDYNTRAFKTLPGGDIALKGIADRRGIWKNFVDDLECDESDIKVTFTGGDDDTDIYHVIYTPKTNESMKTDLTERKQVEPLQSKGIYSVMSHKWIKEPTAEDIPEIDQATVDAEVAKWEEGYQEAKASNDVETIDKYLSDLYDMRKESLAKDGEFGIGNLTFKELRNAGKLDELKDLKSKINSEKLSLKESQAQEIGRTYDRLSKKYGLDFDQLVYGPNGFMASRYPNGFPDFNGDVIYSEKYWDELVAWAWDEQDVDISNSGETYDFFNEDINESANGRLSERERLDYVYKIQRMAHGNQPLVYDNGVFTLNNIRESDVDSIVNALRRDSSFSEVSATAGRFDFSHVSPTRMASRIYTIRGKINI